MALDPRYAYRRGIISCSGPTSPYYTPVMAVLAGFGPRCTQWDFEFRTDRTGTTTLQIGFVDVADWDEFRSLQYLFRLPR